MPTKIIKKKDQRSTSSESGASNKKKPSNKKAKESTSSKVKKTSNKKAKESTSSESSSNKKKTSNKKAKESTSSKVKKTSNKKAKESTSSESSSNKKKTSNKKTPKKAKESTSSENSFNKKKPSNKKTPKKAKESTFNKKTPKKAKESSSSESSTSHKKKASKKKKDKDSSSSESSTFHKKKTMKNKDKKSSTSEEIKKASNKKIKESSTSEEMKKAKESSTPRLNKINKNTKLVLDINKIIHDYDNKEFEGKSSNYLDTSDMNVLTLLTLQNGRIAMLYIKDDTLFIGVWNLVYWEEIFSRVIYKKVKFIQQYMEKPYIIGNYPSEFLKLSILKDNKVVLIYKPSEYKNVEFIVYNCEDGVIMQKYSSKMDELNQINYIGNEIIIFDKMQYIWDCNTGIKSKIKIKNIPHIDHSYWEIRTYDKDNYMYIQYDEVDEEADIGKRVYFFGLSRGVWCKINLHKAPFNLDDEDLIIRNLFAFTDGTVALGICDYSDDTVSFCRIFHFNPTTNKILHIFDPKVKLPSFGGIFSISEDKLMVLSFEKGETKITIYSIITHTATSFSIEGNPSEYMGTFPNGDILLKKDRILYVVDIRKREISKKVVIPNTSKVILMTPLGGVIIQDSNKQQISILF